MAKKELTEARRNAIAWKVLRVTLGRQEIQLGTAKRRVGNLSKETGVPVEELKEFTRKFLLSFVD